MTKLSGSSLVVSKLCLHSLAAVRVALRGRFVARVWRAGTSRLLLLVLAKTSTFPRGGSAGRLTLFLQIQVVVVLVAVAELIFLGSSCPSHLVSFSNLNFA